MKRILAIFLTSLLTLTLAACGGNENSADSDSSNDQSSVKSSLELLTTVWSSYEDDAKFPAAGGDMSEENMTMDAPGKFGIDDTAALDTTLGFPAASAEKIDDAASLVHMMNANTFTCGAFHVKNAGDIADISTAIRDNIMQRQWMCGFPDKLVIVQVDDYIISFFGEKEIVDTFKTKLNAAYTSAETICDDPIA
ncbi:MAG: bacteriocin transport accessory protein [Lachnospiraceae bacterium]|nr:bacteriocin transport accessory protein [Lachnospiraceae bacterium]